MFKVGELFGDAWQRVMKHEGEDEVGEDILKEGGVEVDVSFFRGQVLNASVLYHDDDRSNEEQHDGDEPDCDHGDLYDFGFFYAFEGEGSSNDEEDDEPELKGVYDTYISHKFGQDFSSHDAFRNQHS